MFDNRVVLYYYSGGCKESTNDERTLGRGEFENQVWQKQKKNSCTIQRRGDVQCFLFV